MSKYYSLVEDYSSKIIKLVDYEGNVVGQYSDTPTSYGISIDEENRVFIRNAINGFTKLSKSGVLLSMSDIICYLHDKVGIIEDSRYDTIVMRAKELSVEMDKVSRRYSTKYYPVSLGVSWCDELNRYLSPDPGVDYHPHLMVAEALLETYPLAMMYYAILTTHSASIYLSVLGVVGYEGSDPDPDKVVLVGVCMYLLDTIRLLISLDEGTDLDSCMVSRLVSYSISYSSDHIHKSMRRLYRKE